MRYKGHIIKGRPVDNAGHVREGDVFICLEGARHDGHRFIPEACRLGASLIVSEKKITGCPVRCLRVKNARVCLAELSNLYYRNPSRKLSLVGITGTNGKTTISYLIRNMLKSAGIESSLIGTNAHYIGTTKIVSANTTPGHLDINKILRESLRRGIREGVMEVSSHALIQNRIGGIEFKYRIFSNISAEHLDYHKSMRKYVEAKKIFFQKVPKTNTLIINADDPCASRMVRGFHGKILRYGFKAGTADITAVDIQMTSTGTRFAALLSRGKAGRFEIASPLIGIHNVYNILAAIGFGVARELPEDAIAEGVRRTKVAGRLEKIPFPERHIYVDYAHTHDALENVLKALKPIAKGRLIVVFGCGGDRDRTKRPKMGKVAARFADISIITNDNPRGEDPAKIAREITRGFGRKSRRRVILDRARAIMRALEIARPDDLILVAGKGHERGQIMQDRVIPFNDKTFISSLKEKR